MYPMFKEESDFRRYNLLAWETDSLYHEISRMFGLTDSAVNILYLICFEDSDALLSDIVRLSGLQKQTINSSLRNLEKKGLIEMRPVNGKMKSVALTEEGSAFCDRTIRKLMDWENEALSGFSKKEVKLFLRLMDRYLESVSRSVTKYQLDKLLEEKN
jgi:DNA-binding MarR family transcriptional regulator